MDALRSQIAISLRLHFRNRMALIYGYLFPTIFLIAFWVLYRFEEVPLIRHVGELLTVTALGDVHGHLELMEPYLREVEDRAARRSDRHHVLVVLGDMIDRAQKAGIATPILRLAYAHLQVYLARRARGGLAPGAR